MQDYIDFFETYGAGTKVADIDFSICKNSDIELIPPSVKVFLSEVGISHFANGYLWTLQPNEYVELINEWLPFPERCIPILRTAMADIIYIRNGEIMILNSNWGLVDYTIDEDAMFFNHFLTNDDYLKDVFNKSLFDELQDKSLDLDECFGFNQILALGGNEKAENLYRVGMLEYLDILFRSNEEIRFFAH